MYGSQVRCTCMAVRIGVHVWQQVRLGQVRWMGAGVWGLAPSQVMKGQTLWGWERGSGGETPSQGMRARLLGWPGQVGIIFERKRFFERTLFEQKFLYIYKAYFSFELLLKFGFFLERTLIQKNVQKQRFSNERHSKEKNEFCKNVIRSINLIP